MDGWKVTGGTGGCVYSVWAAGAGRGKGILFDFSKELYFRYFLAIS